MEKAVMSALCFLLMLLIAASGAGCSAGQSTKRLSRTGEEAPIFLEMEEAVADIARNDLRLESIKQRTDAASSEYWDEIVADKLPSQPVAVIRLMTRMGLAVDRMCPREVIEGAIPYDEYVLWMERAVDTLGSFTMNDAKEEKTRRACLAEIRKALATKDQWRY